MGKDNDLIEAGRTGNVPLIEKLLGQRFRIKRVPGFATPLGLAFSSLRRTVNVNAQSNLGDTSLHLASLNGHHDAVQTLLKHDASANLMDASGCFPLHLAAWSGNAAICRTLLTLGPSLAKVNEQNSAGDTALHTAAQYGHTDTVRVLLQNFADPLVRNQSCQTALDLACLYGRLECVRLLLAACPAQVHSSTVHHSALHLAARNGHKDVVLVLLKAGVDVNSVCESGSALHEAAQFGKTETVSLLLRQGVDLSLQDSVGRTALELAHVTNTESSREIARLITLNGEAKFASYPRPTASIHSANEQHPETRTNSLKLSKQNSCSSYSSDYAASVNSSDFSSISGHSNSFSGASCSPSGVVSDIQRQPKPPDVPIGAGYENVVPALGRPAALVERAGRQAEQRPARTVEYAQVTCKAQKWHTLPRACPQVVYSEDLYDVVEADWVNGTQETMSINQTVLMEKDEPVPVTADTYKFAPAPNKAEYLDMDSSKQSFRKPSQTAVSCDDEYVEVRPLCEPCQPALLTQDDVNVSQDKEKWGPVNENSTSELVSSRPPSLELEARRGSRDVTRDDVPHLSTPDHPPPSPTTAMRGIHLAIQPLDKRRSKDMETSTDADLVDAVHSGIGLQGSEAETEVEVIGRLATTPESSEDTSSSSDDDDDEGSGSAVAEVRTSVNQPFKVDTDDACSLIKGSTPAGKRRAMSAMYEDMFIRSPIKRQSLNLSQLQHHHDDLENVFKEIDDMVVDLKSHKDHSSPVQQNSSVKQRGVALKARAPSMNGSTGEKARDDSHSEDWAEIADIMASFGGRITRESVFMRDFEEEFTRLITGSSKAQSVGDWLASFSLCQYENILVANGFDDMDFMTSNVLEEADLIEMGIYNESHRDKILTALKQLPAMTTLEDEASMVEAMTVEEWLRSIHLDVYLPMFVEHGYTNMDKVHHMWELELTTVLDVTTLGHRKRIIGSLGLSAPHKRLDNMDQVDLTTLTIAGRPVLPIFRCESWTLGSEDSGVALHDLPHTASSSESHDTNSNSDMRDATSDLSSDVGTTSSSTSASSDKSLPMTLEKSRTTTSEIEFASEETLATATDFRPEHNHRTVYPTVCPTVHPTVYPTESPSYCSEQFQSYSRRKLSSENSECESECGVRRRPPSQPVSQSGSGCKRLSYSGLELRPPHDTMHDNNYPVQQWRHLPEELIKGCCYYYAQYLGSTYIRELNEESTHESIMKLKRRHWERLKGEVDNVGKLPLITLAISYRGVKFIDAKSKKVICEHEIGNIFCVRQHDEHRNFFAYLTEDMSSSKHYCHVFSVRTTELAAEITLTLGEAFEVAYQMALRDKADQTSREYEEMLDVTSHEIDFALTQH